MSNIPLIEPDETKKEIIDFIRNKINESNTNGIVIGLSGGLDSSTIAYLSSEAIDKGNVLGILMPSKTTPKEDNEHAKLIASKLEIETKEINIDNILNKYLKDLESENSKLAIGNLKARIRMTILYYYANLNNYLVMGTSNKSEILIGYFTKYGDGAADAEPIGHIYKSQLKKIAKDWSIPSEIINKPPRAGLWENQNDEDEIGMTYELLDKILYMLVDEKKDKKEIADILEIPINKVKEIDLKVENNKHKSKLPDII